MSRKGFVAVAHVFDTFLLVGCQVITVIGQVWDCWRGEFVKDWALAQVDPDIC